MSSSSMIIARSTADVDWVKQQLTSKFEAHDLGEANHFLGIDIKRDRSAHTVKLSQKRLTAQLVDTYGLTDSKSKTVPLSSSKRLTKSEGELLDKETHTYTHLIGSRLVQTDMSVPAGTAGLLYLSVCTRPDI